MKWLLIVILLFCGCQVKKPPQTYAEKQALRIAMLRYMVEPTWGIPEAKAEIEYQLYMQERNGR